MLLTKLGKKDDAKGKDDKHKKKKKKHEEEKKEEDVLDGMEKLDKLELPEEIQKEIHRLTDPEKREFIMQTLKEMDFRLDMLNKVNCSRAHPCLNIPAPFQCTLWK